MASDQGRGDGLRRQESNWVQQQELEEMAAVPAEHSVSYAYSTMHKLCTACRYCIFKERHYNGKRPAGLVSAAGKHNRVRALPSRPLTTSGARIALLYSTVVQSRTAQVMAALYPTVFECL